MLLSVFFLFIGLSFGEEYRIASTNDFSSFVSNVNSGTNYSGTTVFLDSDLSLYGYNEPTGLNYTYQFRGVFDGQGYVISNLKMSSSSSRFVGLFGYSEGLIIRNVVLDSSCSITNSYSGSYYDVYAGGIIGYCSGQCNIENNVNMASVSFSGSTSSYDYLFLGGIAGYLESSEYNNYVKNCANYGSTIHSRTSSRSYIGGIVGYLANSNYKYIYNCLNYGTITHSGTTSDYLYLGGIAGYTYYTHIENCVSAGKISSSVAAKYDNYIGSLVGYVDSYMYINYCYYTDELNGYNMYGYGTPTSIHCSSYNSNTFELNETVSLGYYSGNPLIDALNAASGYYMLREYSCWLLNKNRKTVSFTINDRANPIKIDYQIILLPSLASEGKVSFDGWYTDSGCTTPLTSYEITTTTDTSLYGKFKQNTDYYIITFDTRGGTPVPSIQAQFGIAISLPNNLTKDSCTVAFWEFNCGDNVGFGLIMPAKDFTLYAVWECAHIKTLDDFLDFSKVVNSGKSYSETTVFLDSDLSLSGYTVNSIGMDYNQYFLGVFDGQGYVISNLTISSSSSYYTGLFGYSEGLTIKNVVLDSSCSITSSYSSSSDAYVGGIIGYCDSEYGQCNIENNVNMASVTFSGDISSYSLYLGGIAGCLQSSPSYTSTVKNCANYGSVTHSGTSYKSYIGGVVGYLANSNYKYIYNCLNYGTITHSGTTSDYLYLGGIVGSAYYTHIENCVSAGKISSSVPAKYDNYIGSLVGYVDSYMYINYCYYADGLSGYSMYGSGTPTSTSNTPSYNSNTFELNETVSLGYYSGNPLIDALNAVSDYYMLRDYSHWLLNNNSRIISFTINSRASLIKMNYQIILLPSLASEGNIGFDGWYTNSGCTTPLTSYEVTTTDTSLYGKFKQNTDYYTITFNTRGGTPVSPIQAQFGTTISLSNNSIRDYCVIASWENVHGDNYGLNFTMIGHNITLYAVWECAHLKTPDDFLDFSKVVNSGTNYSGTTIFLDSDLSLPGYTSINPIGYDSDYHFRGVFDGQGHVISNFNITKSSQYMGLFGYSKGLTARNIVLDPSCSITSTSSRYYAYVGGIIGYCPGQCNIESNVNMASVTFSGDISSYSLYLGGIAGCLYSYSSYVKNCANYGSVTHSGTSYSSYIGGVVGYLYAISNYKYKYIYNCLNYGTITHSGTTSSNLYLGGIVGYTWYAYIENCVSAGRISSNNNTYVGSLIGYVSSGTYIKYCYFTNGLSGYRYGRGSPTSTSNTLSYNSNTFELNGTVYIGYYSENSLIDALNAVSDYYMLRDYSHWLLNNNSRIISFTINSRASLIKMNYQIILLPSLASEGNIGFDGWYTNSGCTTPLTSYEVTTTDTSLYGKFGQNISYTISFNTRGGTPVPPISAQVGTTISLSNSSTRGYCTVRSWETKKGYNVGFSFIMPARDITFYAVWKCTHIETLDDFISFSKVVNSGTSFSGTTIFLDSDLSLSGYAMNPIGSFSYHFSGIFDGQGYVISNLKITKSSQYVGLFRHSYGLTIRNVVLGSSCLITNSYNGSNSIYVGGIIGYCYSNYGQCNIENNVNMASVTFSGSISGNYNLCLGGIAGYLPSSNNNYNIYVKNCANYGSVTHSGTSKYSYIGGVVGSLYYWSSYYKYIYNCLNYGTITHSGTSSGTLYLGGIAGYTYYAYIENCVSPGRISTNNNTYVGGFVGYVDSYMYINYCYYTDDLSDFKLYGRGKPASTSNTPSTPTIISTAVTNLNSYATSNNWNKWLLNTNSSSVTFKINNGIGFTTNTKAIILPGPANNSNCSFDGWYIDGDPASLFTTSELSSDITLYGLTCRFINNIILAFNYDNGTTPEVTILAFNSSIVYPDNPTKEGYTFSGWDKKTTKMPAYNLNITAQWTINKYTITFIFDNGAAPETKTLNYSAAITYPGNPIKEGYAFAGWKPNPTIMPAHNLTITAQWVQGSYTATFDVNEGDPSSLSATSMTVKWNEEYGKLPAPTRVGHTFGGWYTEPEGGNKVESEDKVTIPVNHTLYAHWTINNHTLTFVFNNGEDPEQTILCFNETIEYPENVTRDNYTFIGWDNDIEFMPDYDLIITARWSKDGKEVDPSKEGKSNYTGLILGITIPTGIIIIIIIITITISVIFLKRKINGGNNNRRLELYEPLVRKDGFDGSDYSRIATTTGDDIVNSSTAKNIRSILTALYPPDYMIPIMKEALTAAGLSKEKVELICNASESIANKAMREGKLFEGFTEEDAAAIAMYTYDFGSDDFESNPFRIINKSLAERNYASIQKASGLVYLVMAALRKLPRVTGKTLYRGVRGQVNMDKDHYYKGNVVTWMGLSSTSPDMDATRKFLAMGSRSKAAMGTLFIIEDGWGYDIQPYSMFLDEAEILLEPERQFSVKSVIPAEGMTIINLQMLDTPLTLPSVFGEGRE